jgi:glycosyltransferase involved in cell wall biosynthesis
MGVYRVRINFLVNEVASGWKPTDTQLGGTEESVVRWAEELARQGHVVMVYHNSNDEDWDDFTYRSEHRGSRGDGTYNGVWYTPREAYTNPEAYDPIEGAVCINIKSSEVKPKEPTIYFTNETDASDLDLNEYSAVIWPSRWSRDNIPVNNDRTFVVPHGYDPKKIYPSKKIPKQCLYASSPDRGLETLLRSWPRVHAAHPDATLKVTYGAPSYDIPGVEFLGEVTEEKMNQLYRESDIWTHPASGGELFCITGVKAQAAGCIPVVIPTMALSETVKYGYFADTRNYTETLARALSEDKARSDIRSSLAQEKFVTWEGSTSRLLKVIDSVLR